MLGGGSLNLGCMTELPCACRKEKDGTGYCIKAEGDCEYQILDGGGGNVGRLTEKDGSRWQLKNVPWEALGEGQVITRDVSDRVYGALCKLKDYEDTEMAPDEIELLKYHHDERITNEKLKMTLKRKIEGLKGSSDYPHNFKGQMVEGFEWVLSLLKSEGTPAVYERRDKLKPALNKYYYFCPNCGSKRSIKQKHNFCHDCGQAFDWGENSKN